ncbi:hypothetical protein Y023_5058 [Burkholderia pseudomallei A79D]|nr:hypothetical protein Y023_5058 [Burkholderia pseudomallei A79D]
MGGQHERPFFRISWGGNAQADAQRVETTERIDILGRSPGCYENMRAALSQRSALALPHELRDIEDDERN